MTSTTPLFKLMWSPPFHTINSPLKTSFSPSPPTTPTMATLPILFSLLSLSLFSLSHCHSIRDLLTSRGLPAGLFPDSVRAYDLNPNGLLQVFMDQPCTAKFETRVFFESVVRANLSYGGLIGVEGLSQEELFLWLPVKDIIVYDPSSGLILFDIGVAHKEFSLSLFEDPPVCMPQGVLLEEVGRKELGFQVQR